MSITPGPTPDWNRVPVRWHHLYLDESIPTGNLEISVVWDRAIDEDPTDPIAIIGSKPIIIELDPDRLPVDPVDFTLPATDDPDISRTGFTWHCKENLDDGGGLEYDFQTPLASLPGGVNLVRVPAGGNGDPGVVIPIYGRLLYGSGAPSSGTGTTGDWYIDQSTLALYGPKDNTTGWPAGVSLTRFLVWNGTAYVPSRADNNPYVFIGPGPAANPETLGLMQNGDTWIDNSDPGTTNVPPVIPIYGNGQPEGVVTAPVGTEYIDLAQTAGARKWFKNTGTGNTGWVVTSGDTGRRNIASLLVNGWTSTYFKLRRQDSTVSIAAQSLVGTAATNDLFYTLPLGFKFNAIQAGSVPWGTVYGSTSFATPPNIHYSTGAISDTERPATGYWVAEWQTDDPWPTSLPGTAG